MKLRIHEAIAEVLRAAGRALTPQQIHAAVVEKGLFPFNALDPVAIVRQELRRACVDLDFLSARKQWKRFALAAGGAYRLLDDPVEVGPTLLPSSDRPEEQAGPLVSVPDDRGAAEPPADPAGPSHKEIQYRLLKLGADLGLRVWAPLNDRNCRWGSRWLTSVPGLLDTLPHPFTPAVARTVEFIDVLWADEQSGIVAAFEVEHTSTVYSGLLRMCDLLTLLPAVQHKLYLVAPDERLEEFRRQVRRPTFAKRKPRLDELCRFVPYSALVAAVERHAGVIRHLRPDFLDTLAVACPPEAGE